ncbi:MAG: ATP synthase F1 subunit gamma [Acetatifactor sp.]|nr:ATP synthase F1 subunit gamma [Acetatifactor sp.]
MPSLKDVKSKIAGVGKTKQITKAMKRVSTVKLQRSRAIAENSKAYFNCMYQTVNRILTRVGSLQHKYLQSDGTGKKAVIVISSNRGLAGGYNSNIVKLVTRHEGWSREDVLIYAVGRKGRDALVREGYEVRMDMSDIVEEPAYPDAMLMCSELLKAYAEGEIGEIYLAYTSFKNTVSHVPTLLKLLPVEQEAESAEEESGVPMNFEAEDEEALEMIIPKYVTSLIYGGLMEAVASENGARMQAMDNATSNAEEMISDLTLKYNRARQGSITQELTEIIAGAEAIS